MEKCCENCKWNSYNCLVKETEAIKNPIKRFFRKLNLEFSGVFQIEYEHMKCNHPEVYKKKWNAEYVYEDKNDGREKIFCAVARDGNSTPNYCLCGKDGKFFEKNADNSR